MNKKDIISEAGRILDIEEIDQLKISYSVWKQQVLLCKDYDKSVKDSCYISLQVYDNPNEPSEITMKSYKNAVRETIAILQSGGCEYDRREMTDVLEHFDLFLESMFRGIPHKKATIDIDSLRSIIINNEYDIQYILASYLRPLYPMCRTEITEDTGYENVRVDIKIDEDTVIEIKCSRPTMSRKKLIEEIEADIIHYSSRNIYFFIYDKCRIIDNPEIFKKTYENKLHEKNIHIVILQSKELI